MAEFEDRKRGAVPYAFAPATTWGHLTQYDHKTALEFPTEEALDSAIEALWADASLKHVPRTYVDSRTMIVPTESVGLFREKGWSFAEVNVISAGSLPPEKMAALRREQGTS